MSILFDDASLQYALAASPAIAFPFATGCWIYVDDVDIDQTFAAIQDASSEDNYYSLGLYGRKQEVTDITTVADFQSSNSLDGEYFLLSSPTVDYYVWFSIDSASVDPAPGGGLVGIEVNIAPDATANAVAIAVQVVLDAHGAFGASVISNVVTVTNAVYGVTPDAADFNTDFTFDIIIQGTDDAVIRGEIVDNLGVSELADSAGAVTLNTWHHALAIFNTATDIRVYLDGVNEGLSQGGTAVAPLGLDTLSIGRRSTLTPEGYTSGRIAELVMWNLTTVLSTSEIGDVAIDKQSPVLTRTDELLYYAPIYNNDDPIIDIMAHLNATLSNAPLTADHPPVQMFEPETFMRFRSGPVEFGLDPFDNLQFTHIANWEMIKGLSNGIGFNQNVQHNVIWIQVAHNIGFTHSIQKNAIIEVSIVHSVNFTQQQGPTTEESVSNSIGFTHQAARAGDPRSTIEFTHDVVAEASKGIDDSIEFTHQVDVNQDATKALADGVQFTQAVVAWKDEPCDRHEYNPQGAGMPVIVIGVASDITLVCGADSITLRNPDFDNSESVDVDRALNISRGGTPKLMRDSQWPEQTTHTISISVMTRTKALELLDFLKNCLGLLVTYTDHEARVWEGIIINPDSAVIDGGNDCKYSATLEIQSTLVP
jgi:hypothetical protein